MLDKIPELIKKTFPIPGKYRSRLPSDIARLSKLLTNNRGERALSYLSKPDLLSAYLYYFLPWNLYRLCLLIPALNISLAENDIITDLGCGPLTFTCALWISCPDLRNIPLVFNCVDRSSPALEAGKKIFTALCKNSDTWKINIIKEDIDLRKIKTSVTRKRKPASLVCAVNLFNEIYEKLPHNNIEELRRTAEKTAKLLHGEASQEGKILTVEPGVPQSGRFISLLRDELIKLNRQPFSPCTHSADCPFLEGAFKLTRGRGWIDTKKRWCHFAFESFDAPKELTAISKAAKLPKERLVLSYLFSGGSRAAEKNPQKINNSAKEKQDIRVISDAFTLPENRFGRYGCCEKGLVLVTGDKNRISEIPSLSLTAAYPFENEKRDSKSGALLASIKDKT